MKDDVSNTNTTNYLHSLTAEAAADKAVAATTEAKPLVQVLNSNKLYTASKLAPAPRFGRKANWKVSEDFIPPNDGKTFLILYTINVTKIFIYN